MGVDVDGLAYRLHRPTTCNHRLRGQNFMLGVALSHRAAVGGGTFSLGGGGCEAPLFAPLMEC
jgi:hypothetical protein